MTRKFQQSESMAGCEWLFRQIGAFFKWLGVLHEAAPFLFWLLLIGCATAAIGAVRG